MDSTNPIATVKALRELGLPLPASVRMTKLAREGYSPRYGGIQVTCVAGRYTIGDYDPRKAA